MKAEKKVIGTLEKCYSIAPLEYQGKHHLLVAAEKQDPCLLFDLEGNQEEVVWEQPGGTMSMVQMPGSDGVFLATHKFYSPNDSKEAKIVLVTPEKEGSWKVQTLTGLPFVHRFDILTRNGQKYLIACALKSGHEYKDDWSSPGKVYAAVLPEDLSGYDEEHPLPLTVLQEGMLKNHGYYRTAEGDYDTGVISADNGVFQFVPPQAPGGEWEIRRLTSDAASDGLLIDLDGDGQEELLTIAPFHGENIFIYKKTEQGYEKVYSCPVFLPFSHAICGGMICGRPRVIIGHRKGNRDLTAFSYDQSTGTYVMEVLDRDCGPANVFHYTYSGADWLLSANREINEIALYRLTEE